MAMGNSNVGHGGRRSGANKTLSPREAYNIIIQRNSRLETGLREATDEIGRLNTKLRELEAENVEWREHYTTVEHITANLREQLNSKNQEIQRLAPAYGSYCVSGANPYFLKKSFQMVSHALHDFVLSIRIPAGKPSTDIADLSKDEALVSSIFFSRFERVDLGLEDVATFIPPAQLPELSFQEYKAFDAYMEDKEDCGNLAAVERYGRNFRTFLQLVYEDMNKLCFPLRQIGENDDRHLRFINLAIYVWMLHKLTLSFDKANVRIMRVGRGEEFNKEFMMTVPGRQDEEHKLGTPPLVVQHLILPGLWINGSIFKCYVFLGSPVHQEINCTSEPGNEVGAVNGTHQPQDMDTGVETSASEERPAIDAMNGTDQHHFIDISVETLTSEERPAIGISPLRSFYFCGIRSTFLWRLRSIMSSFLWRAILFHFWPRSRGQICEVMETQTLDLCQPLIRDESSSSGEPQELEPQPECNQPASLLSDSINSSESEPHVVAEASHPPHSEQVLKNGTPASSDGAGAPRVCKNTEDVQVAGVQENSKTSSRPEELSAAEHSGRVPGIGFSL